MHAKATSTSVCLSNLKRKVGWKQSKYPWKGKRVTKMVGGGGIKKREALTFNKL